MRRGRPRRPARLMRVAVHGPLVVRVHRLSQAGGRWATAASAWTCLVAARAILAPLVTRPARPLDRTGIGADRSVGLSGGVAWRRCANLLWPYQRTSSQWPTPSALPGGYIATTRSSILP